MFIADSDGLIFAKSAKADDVYRYGDGPRPSSAKHSITTGQSTVPFSSMLSSDSTRLTSRGKTPKSAASGTSYSSSFLTSRTGSDPLETEDSHNLSGSSRPTSTYDAQPVLGLDDDSYSEEFESESDSSDNRPTYEEAARELDDNYYK